MKREIKFRFWTGKEMLDWLCVCQTAFNQFNVVYEYNQIRKEQEPKDKLSQAFDSMLSHGEFIRSGLMYKLFTSFNAVPMQFTGWQDMNKVSLYEGDRIRIHWRDGEYTEETVSYSIEYGYFMYGNNPLCELKDPEVLFEIIGNIYQSHSPTKTEK